MKSEWLVYTVIVGLAWGTYVPMIAFGGRTLEGNRFGAAVRRGGLLPYRRAPPTRLFVSGQEKWPPMNITGLTFAGLAGVAGAVGGSSESSLHPRQPADPRRRPACTLHR